MWTFSGCFQNLSQTQSRVRATNIISQKSLMKFLAKTNLKEYLVNCYSALMLQLYLFFPKRLFYTQRVTNILHFHLEGRFQSTSVNIETTRFFCSDVEGDWSSTVLGKSQQNPHQSKQPNKLIIWITFLKLFPSHTLGCHSSRLFQSSGNTIYLEVCSSS